MSVRRAIREYERAYRALYNRRPRQLTDLGPEWVLLNGARMTVLDLQMQTHQLRQDVDDKRGLLNRLVGFFKKM